MYKYRKLAPIALLSILALAVPAVAAADSQTAELVVDGMVTPNCPVLVKKALERLDGVQAVEASLETKRVSVTYRAGTVTPDRIVEVLEDQVGLSARFVDVARFAIEGMATPNCPVLVKKAVGRLPGVLDVDADLKTMSATVVFLTDQLSTDQIAATIVDKVGLRATLVPRPRG